ncbi:Subtilisin-like serine-protease S [Euphorbia peplus]|nr:Subtilisin-like serine-protease S [Euphorbia peplus]
MRINSILILLLFTTLTLLVHGATSNKKHYIVYMGEHSHPNSESVINANHMFLSSVTTSFQEAKDVALHHYTKSFRGFSAMLTQDQAQKLSESEAVVSVFESKMNKVHTTHSWDFLGVNSFSEQKSQLSLNSSLAAASSDVIVGVIDSGVWPESASFNDKYLGPVPKRFRGACVTGEKFTSANCNRKIIGARFYFKGFEAESGPLENFGKTFFRSPRDADGHGTHTSSTIGGTIVTDVSLLGLAKGTARGGAPNARLAIYKSCWFDLCSDADILAGMDDAINDGVDILSLSLGPVPPQPSYFSDAVSIGAFHAFRKGVVVSCSAGNSFFSGTATNVAPWILTVAASSLDREFNTNVYLGNSKVLKGSSLNPLKMQASYRLISGGAAAAPGVPAKNASFCKQNTLDNAKIKGKIVICTSEILLDNRTEKVVSIQQGGGVGMILIDPLVKEIGFQAAIPCTLIGQEEAQQLQAYMKTDKYAVARIATTVTVLNTKPAPEVTVFSSQGPNIITPDIIKPDITAPGLNILAAWSPVATSDTGGRSVNFNIISGTSMACPHVSAVAAILKSYRPSWSPAEIMSAIMTTATVMDNTGKVLGRDPDGAQTTPFDYGSGHINPAKALNPGLVYDFNAYDIINFLCSTGASTAELKNLTGQPTYCPKPAKKSYDFNYPSIGVSQMHGSATVYRTVTYKGQGPCAYTAKVEYPDGVKVVVTPATLKFTKTGQKMSFRIDFKAFKTSKGNFVFGALTWSSGVINVRSPIGLNVISL